LCCFLTENSPPPPKRNIIKVMHEELIHSKIHDIEFVNWKQNHINLDDWLTVHRSITLANFQLDAQNFYLFTYNTFIKILYMFRALPCSSSGGLRRNCIMQPLVSSLSAGDCPVHRLINNFFLNWCTRQSPAESDDTRGCIYTSAITT
jgi:hypothetical protein